MRAKLQVTLPVATIIPLVVAASVLWAVPGCGQSQRTVAFQEVVRGSDYAYGAEGVPAPTPVLRVITDAQALAAFGSELIPNAQGALGGVDLSQEFVIATLQGSKPTGGYSINVSAVSQQNDDVFVRVEIKEPQPGAVLTQMITSPYDVVRVRRADLTPRGSLSFHMMGPDGQVLAESQADI